MPTGPRTPGAPRREEAGGPSLDPGEEAQPWDSLTWGFWLQNWEGTDTCYSGCPVCGTSGKRCWPTLGRASASQGRSRLSLCGDCDTGWSPGGHSRQAPAPHSCTCSLRRLLPPRGSQRAGASPSIEHPTQASPGVRSLKRAEPAFGDWVHPRAVASSGPHPGSSWSRPRLRALG